MVIIVRPGADKDTTEGIISKVREMGFTPHPIYGVINTVIAVIGERTQEAMETLEAMPGVDRVVPILRPYKLAGREVKPEPTLVSLSGWQRLWARRVSLPALRGVRARAVPETRHNDPRARSCAAFST